MKVLTAEAIDRGIACLTRMRGIADGYDADAARRRHERGPRGGQRPRVHRPGARRRRASTSR